MDACALAVLCRDVELLHEGAEALGELREVWRAVVAWQAGTGAT